MDYKAQWFESQKISPEHSSIKLTQVYVWIYTKDNKLVIVSKDGDKWQLPGGHPKENESIVETAIREVKEETGLDISNYTDQISTFGYYIVTGEENEIVKESFIQLRTFLKLSENSSDLKLGTFENEDELEEDKVKFVKAFTLEEVFNLIHWLKSKEEYLALDSMGLLK